MKVGRVDYRCASIMKLEERKVKERILCLLLLPGRDSVTCDIGK